MSGNKTTFGQWIGEKIEKAGVSQVVIARAVGKRQNQISEYISDSHEPSITVAADMADAVGADLGEFQKLRAKKK